VKITIRDVARLTNLSTATVSRVLNNKPDVSEEARKTVLGIIEKYNYNPSSIARGLALKKTNTIGLILPDITNPFYPELARGVEMRAKDLGYSVILSDIKNDHLALVETVSFLQSKQVDGIIITQWSTLFSKELEKIIKESDVPIVSIDREGGKSCVDFDDFDSAYRAVSYLVTQGHTKIAHITGDLRTYSAQKRYEGYLQCLADNNIEVSKKWVYEGEFTLKSGYAGMTEILKSPSFPTAIFAANDVIAIGAYDAIAEHGLSIPDDISIMGHDDISFASIVRPKLTTMNIPRSEMGESCVNALHALLGKKPKKPEIGTFSSKLCVRDSIKNITSMDTQ